MIIYDNNNNIMDFLKIVLLVYMAVENNFNVIFYLVIFQIFIDW